MRAPLRVAGKDGSGAGGADRPDEDLRAAPAGRVGAHGDDLRASVQECKAVKRERVHVH
jgi:hypothetical protein